MFVKIWQVEKKRVPLLAYAASLSTMFQDRFLSRTVRTWIGAPVIPYSPKNTVTRGKYSRSYGEHFLRNYCEFRTWLICCNKILPKGDLLSGRGIRISTICNTAWGNASKNASQQLSHNAFSLKIFIFCRISAISVSVFSVRQSSQSRRRLANSSRSFPLHIGKKEGIYIRTP